MFGVILAGGSGTRFWPKSREEHPKQLQKIVGSRTLIQETVERLLPVIPVKNILVVTNELHAAETCRQLAEYGFPAINLLAEPVGRNTAPAIAFAAGILRDTEPDAVMGVFPADHVVRSSNFPEVVQKAEQVVGEGHLVTLGIKPGRPETGYGYMEKGAPLKGFDGAFQVKRFTEKPDLVTAKKFVKDGNYFWNSGMYFWQIKILLEEMKTCMPDVYNQLENIVSHTEENKGKCSYRVLDAEGRKIYESLPSESIDYGVMEKSDRVAIIPVELDWCDVGAWNALDEVGEKDADGNVMSENVVSLDCADSILQSENRLIAALGLKNIIVVDTEDALLVSDKNRAQDVKEIVSKLKENNRPEVKTHRKVQKPWGSYTVLETGKGYLVKRLELFPGEKLSLQSHNHRSEHWTVVSGRAEVQRDDEILFLKTNQSVYIPQTVKHRLANPGEDLMVLIEVQIGDDLDENDIIRYEDKYGRA